MTHIPVELFESKSDGFIPVRDDYFENSLLKFNKWTPDMTQEDLEARAKLYYRAVGRFLLHVMADGRNPIPTTVLPEFFRNGK